MDVPVNKTISSVDTSLLQICNSPMDRIEAMQAFVAVADLRGFAPAARKLGLSPSGVTRLIAALEDRLGARLLQRTTRQVTLTDAGSRYLERARRILADIEEAGGCHRGRAHPPRGAARHLGAGRVRPAACQRNRDRLPEALWRCRRRSPSCPIAWSTSSRTASISRLESVICPTRRSWRAMSARCGGSWWPHQDISRRGASRSGHRKFPRMTPFSSAP